MLESWALGGENTREHYNNSAPAEQLSYINATFTGLVAKCNIGIMLSELKMSKSVRNILETWIFDNAIIGFRISIFYGFI